MNRDQLQKQQAFLTAWHDKIERLHVPEWLYIFKAYFLWAIEYAQHDVETLRGVGVSESGTIPDESAEYADIDRAMSLDLIEKDAEIERLKNERDEWKRKAEELANAVMVMDAIENGRLPEGMEGDQ